MATDPSEVADAMYKALPYPACPNCWKPLASEDHDLCPDCADGRVSFEVIDAMLGRRS